MLETYQAILQGNHLEWSDEAPQRIKGAEKVKVFVTILDEPIPASNGRAMAEALEKLAAANSNGNNVSMDRRFTDIESI
jgi:hypothetical protein